MRKQKILCLITNTFHKEYRNKTLIFLLAITGLIVFLVNATMNFLMIPLEQSKLLLPGLLEKKLTLFYIIISVWGGFLATLLGVNCVRSDFEHRVAAQLLSFPIKKSDYLLARIMGTWFIVVGYYIFSLIFAFIIFSFTNQDFQLGINIPLALLVNSLSMLGMISLGVFFSLFFSKLLSLVGTLLFGSMISMSNYYFLSKDGTIEGAGGEGFFYYTGLVLHWIFPRLGTVNYISKAILNNDPFNVNLYLETGHFLVFMALFLGALIWVFQNKELDL